MEKENDVKANYGLLNWEEKHSSENSQNEMHDLIEIRRSNPIATLVLFCLGGGLLTLGSYILYRIFL